MKLNINEIKETLKYIVNNNKTLTSLGKKTSAVEIIGEAGLGKTSSIIQLAEELSMDCIKLDLAQIEELGDLIGFPIKEYETCKDDQCFWVAKDLLDIYISSGYIATGESRMSYAKPMWVPKEDNENGGILILDDWTRADQRVITATMELIDRGTFLSWSLPKNWTIVLSANPDNGDYNVNSIDNATKTRYISFDVEFNLNVWAKWAEEEGIDSRLINFALAYPEIMETKKNVTQTVNPRSMVTFANTISGIKDFSDSKSLALILNIASGCFTDEHNSVGNLFTMFIANKLDKLISPEDLINKKWSTVKPILEDVLYDNGVYRADIASIITTRFINYTSMTFSKKGAKTEPIAERILDLIDDNDKILLSEDLIFNLIKNITTSHPTRTKKLLLNPKVIKKLML
ncbi:MAG: hypothetical protein ACRDCN_03660 [Tannerellaceae bacterium]